MSRIFIEVGLLDWEQREALIASGLLTIRDFRERKTDGDFYCKKSELSSCKLTLGMLLSFSEVFNVTIDRGFITLRDY